VPVSKKFNDIKLLFKCMTIFHVNFSILYQETTENK